MDKERGAVVLVAFYNGKALGVRYLEGALTQAGWRVVTVFFKQFNSQAPSPATDRELELLREVVEREKPALVGLSVMSSMYMETVERTLGALKWPGSPKVVCGGAYASLEPRRLLDRGADYVLRLDGEASLPALALALSQGEEGKEVPGLCWLEGDAMTENPVELPPWDPERQPVVYSPNALLLDKDQIVPGDPQAGVLSYEVIASRGCPFSCSYCACGNLRALYPKGTRPIRLRSVDSVLSELEEARRRCKKMVFVHFYDEIFPTDPQWVAEFVKEYPRRIGLPFSMWTHPKALEEKTLQALVKVGLCEVIMGIQSGSPYIRRDIFHRPETNQEVIHTVDTIARSGVFWASYDFMLLHPFETAETMKETYELIKALPGRYELQLHGLNFLPGTPIVDMAVDGGYVDREEMEKIMYAPMAQQFAVYWREEGDPESRLWYQLSYLWQFPTFRKRCLRYEQDPTAFQSEVERDCAKAEKMARRRYLRKKATVALRGLMARGKARVKKA